MVWLAAGGARREHPAYTEGFFHDRHLRGEHHLPWTARGASATDGPRLWEWCEARTAASALA